MQVSVLTDQVEAQGEKIRDLDLCLDEHRDKLNATEEMLQQVCVCMWCKNKAEDKLFVRRIKIYPTVKAWFTCVKETLTCNGKLWLHVLLSANICCVCSLCLLSAIEICLSGAQSSQPLHVWKSSSLCTTHTGDVVCTANTDYIATTVFLQPVFIYHCRSFSAELRWRRRSSNWCLKCPT